MLDLEVKLIPYGSWLSPTTSSGALRLNRNRVTLHPSEERPASRIRGCRCSLALDGVPRDQCGKLSYRSARLGASGQLGRVWGIGIEGEDKREKRCVLLLGLYGIYLDARAWIGRHDCRTSSGVGSSIDVHEAIYRCYLPAA